MPKWIHAVGWAPSLPEIIREDEKYLCRPVWGHLCRCYRFKCVEGAAIRASVLTCIDTSTKRCVSWPFYTPHLPNSATQRPNISTFKLHVPLRQCVHICLRVNTASYTVQCNLPARSRDAAVTSDLQDEHIWFIYTQKNNNPILTPTYTSGWCARTHASPLNITPSSSSSSFSATPRFRLVLPTVSREKKKSRRR